MKKTSTLLTALTLAFGAAMLPAHANNSAAMSSDQIEARHDAAKKECDALKGDQRDTCMKRADAEKDKAEARADAAEDKAEANREVAKTEKEADREVAMKKCDEQSGDAKDKCQADVKNRFGK